MPGISTAAASEVVRKKRNESRVLTTHHSTNSVIIARWSARLATEFEVVRKNKVQNGAPESAFSYRSYREIH